MEEIDLKELFSYAQRKISIIIMITLLCVVISQVYVFFIKTPMYKSSSTIVMVGVKASDDGITQNDVALNQKLIGTYREIITSRRILEPVINNLNLKYSINELKNNISVSSKNEVDLINISVSNEDKELAALITNEITKVFSEEIVEIYSIENISVIDEAIVSEKPYNVSVVKDLIIGLMIGILLSGTVVFVMFFFDTTVKNIDEISRKLNLPIIGTIPNVENGDL